MIDPNLSSVFGRLAARERDVSHAYEPGFEPEMSDVAGHAGVQPSADPLSVVAPEGAFFVAAGDGSSVTLSRAGGFTVSNGELRFAGDTRAVLGFAADRKGSLVQLRVDPYDAAMGRVADARVDVDGTFAYTRATVDPRTGERRSERVTVGRVALARLPAGTQPERVDATHVRAPHGVSPLVGMPADGRFGSLATHARDLGRVDILAGLERMREAYDDLESFRAATLTRFKVERTTMDLVK